MFQIGTYSIYLFIYQIVYTKRSHLYITSQNNLAPLFLQVNIMHFLNVKYSKN